MKNLAFLALALGAFAGSGGEYRLVVNEDNDHYFHLDSAKMTREDLRAYVDTFAVGGQVSHVFFSPCGQPANFDSKVWEPVWKRLEDPAFMEFAKGNRHVLSWPENCKLLHERGIDPYAVWIERSRELKISPWLSMRMNDVHFATHPRMQGLRSVKFWRDHPVFKNLPYDGALDELFFRIVKEGRELPLDGLEKENLLAVGEGGKACYLYLGQAKVLKGQALLSFGFDVLADTVEGTALLDGMIGYVRSSAFAPTGVCTLPQGNTK